MLTRFWIDLELIKVRKLIWNKDYKINYNLYKIIRIPNFQFSWMCLKKCGNVHESFEHAQLYCDLIGEQNSKFSVANSYDGTTVQWKESRCPGFWLISISFVSKLKTVMWCLGADNSIFSGSCFGVRPGGTEGDGWDLSQPSFCRK